MTSQIDAELIARLKMTRPESKAELDRYLQFFFNIKIPDKIFTPGHTSPLEFFWHSFQGTVFRRALIWSCRAGGKTWLLALGAKLDSVFRPKCQTRILGGSRDQSRKGYEYFEMWARDVYPEMLAKEPMRERTDFINGSRVEILVASQKSVRGPHAQRVKFDEVDEFKPEIYKAASLIAQTMYGIPATVEEYSTQHHAYGVMNKLLQSAKAAGAALYKWNIWEIIERCLDRICSQCPLLEDCQGRAKGAEGYYLIDDAIALRKGAEAISEEQWTSEMLCQSVSVSGAVYKNFKDEPPYVQDIAYRPDLRTYAAFDFGVDNPNVCLFFQQDSDNRLWWFDEVYIKGLNTLQFAQRLKPKWKLYHPVAAWHDPSGLNEASILRSQGISSNGANNDIALGIEMVRRRFLLRKDGKPGSIIGTKCKYLRRELPGWHFKEGTDVPVKMDDHSPDAHRYGVVGIDVSGRAGFRRLSGLYTGAKGIKGYVPWWKKKR